LSEAKHLSKKKAAEFRRRLLGWYRTHGRDLPWRRTRDPYAIFISEIMLQQTQVATVIPYYERWLRRFPNIQKLARASEQDVLHAWQGLGYYARARNIHRAAEIVQQKHHGKFPSRLEDVAALPGVGRYTANAIATFAYDRSVPVVEANTARLLSRVFNLRIAIDSSAGRNALWETAEALLPKFQSCHHNSALMDLGATVCIARFPKCSLCPVRGFCRAKDPTALPIKKPRRNEHRMTEFHLFSRTRDRILLEQSRKRWRGLWILPSLTAPLEQQPIYVDEFHFTHHRIKLAVYFDRRIIRPNEMQRWFSISKLDALPIPSPHRRALNRLLAGS
jgi:A/G-specific adenine glycosylase